MKFVVYLLNLDDLGDISDKSFELTLLEPGPNRSLQSNLLIFFLFLIHLSQLICHLCVELIEYLINVLIVALNASRTEMLDPCETLFHLLIYYLLYLPCGLPIAGVRGLGQDGVEVSLFVPRFPSDISHLLHLVRNAI